MQILFLLFLVFTIAEGRQNRTQYKEPTIRLRIGAAAPYKDIKFWVGLVFRHKRFNYMGVILSYDTKCENSEEWIKQMGVDDLPHGRNQPFYNVLVDESFRWGHGYTYVAEENIIPDVKKKDGDELPIRHQALGQYFERWSPSAQRYIPKEWLKELYPHDALVAEMKTEVDE